jgi:polysaccharide biosynthesis protein PslG
MSSNTNRSTPYLTEVLDRRALLRRGALLGLSVPAVLAVLAACGDDGDEPEEITEPQADDTSDEAQDDPDDIEDAEEPTPDPEPELDDEPEEPDEVETEPASDAEATPPEGDAERPQSDEMAYGFNIAWRADEDGEEFNRRTLSAVETAGFNWIRFQIHWNEIQREPEWFDPLPVDRLVETYDGSGIRILISVIGAPEWAMDPDGTQLLADWEPFGDFMTFLADRYRGRVHAWEIWNEQNMAYEMHGTVRVSDYAYLLEAGFRGVKDGDPEAIVVFGGLTPTGVNDPSVAVNDVDYLREFYSFEDGSFQQYFDVLGVHLSATNNPPETSYPDNPGPGEWSNDNSFYFLRGLDLGQVKSEFGDERSAWVTEFGWTTENQAPGYEYGAEISEDDQADFLVRAFDVAREQMPWITGMFVWNLNFSTITAPEDEKHPWSVLEEDWSPRPAYTALQEMTKP